MEHDFWENAARRAPDKSNPLQRAADDDMSISSVQ